MVAQYLMMRMVVVGLGSEGVNTTATSLASQGCSSRRRTPSPGVSSAFSPSYTHTEQNNCHLTRPHLNHSQMSAGRERYFPGAPSGVYLGGRR